MDLDYVFHPKNIGPVSIDAAITKPRHPASNELVGYWRSKAEANGNVPRGSIRPKDIPHLLPQLFIAEPVLNEWRYRLVGTNICSRFGKDLTGLTVGELFGEASAKFIRAQYNAVIESKTPLTLKGLYTETGFPDAVSESIYLPIRAIKNDKHHVFGGVFFLDAEYVRRWLGFVKLPPISRIYRVASTCPPALLCSPPYDLQQSPARVL